MNITAEDARVSYPNGRALGPFSLKAGAGDWLGLAGPNGAGKTTLLKLLAGMLKPTSGSVRLDGQDLARIRPLERARTLAVVPQRLEVPFDLPAATIVELGRLPYLGWSERLLPLGGSHRLRVEESLREVDLWELRDRSFRELSGGEQQRVLLAAALAQEAPILLLDEPTASLDPGMSQRFLDVVRRLAGRGRTIVMAAHDLSLLGQHCTRVALVAAGRVAAEGPPETVLQGPLLSDLFGTELHVWPHPGTGRPLVLPRS